MMLVAALLIASAVLPSALGVPGPACPTRSWKFLKFPDGTQKCYIHARDPGNVDLENVCQSVHPEARPTLLESLEEIGFIQKEVLPDNGLFTVGYHVDEDNVIRDYMGNNVSSSVLELLPRFRFPDAFLYLSKHELVFKKYIRVSWPACFVTLDPLKIVQYSVPPIYYDINCPPDWKRVNVGYAIKCFKVIDAGILYRCHLSEVCKSSHPSALPASIRNKTDKDYLFSTANSHGLVKLYTGIHVPCDPAQHFDKDKRLRFVQVNGDPVTIDPDSVDNTESVYAEGSLYEPLYGYYSNPDRLTDLSERAPDSKMLCEIYLPQIHKDMQCPEHYDFDKYEAICIHEFLRPHNQ